MKFQTTTRPLRELVHEFHVGGILLPQFQRDYVWKPAKLRNLLDSLLKGYPIGGFYLWRPAVGTLDVKPKSMGAQKFSPVFEGYLIDGQQRLTSLEAAFGLYAGEDKRGAELRCFLDLAAPEGSEGREARETRLFVTYAGNKSVARRVDDADPTLLPLTQLFGGANFELRRDIEAALRTIPGWNAKRVDAALGRFDQACVMLDQQVPCSTISDVEDREAVEVFSRLNKGGSALSQGDVRAAELARGHAVDVLKRMRAFVVQDRPQRMGFGFSFAFRAIVLFHRESAQFSALKPDWMDQPGPRGRTLRESWKAAERAIDEALEFVDTQMGWSRRMFVPSANAVIVLAAALDRADHEIADKDVPLYRRWLCLAALRGVFQGSVESTINRFYKAITATRGNPANALLGALKRDERRRVSTDDFLRRSQPWGPATQVLLAYLVGEGAKDWASGEEIAALGRRGGLGALAGELAVHTLFPREVLAAASPDADDANRVANFAVVSRPTDSHIRTARPDAVAAAMTPTQRQLAAAQFFGDAAGDRLAVDRYDEFCTWRADRLTSSINAWLGLD
jgi:hypothetical protein